MYFKDKFQALIWWGKLPCSEEWVIIHKERREKSGHRYELAYIKFDEQGKMYSNYIICFSKKEAVLLAQKIKEANSYYITNIKKLY